MKRLELSGKIFGRLNVLCLSNKSNDSKRIYWKCLCSCGNTTIVSTAELRSGKTRSCGCLQRERTSLAKKTHGKTGTPFYQVWRSMHSRCYNKNSNRYNSHGKRGISVCDRWHTFSNFQTDMLPSYQSGLSLDRIDNDGNYCPENCRWANDKQQSRNRRNNVMLTHNGETHCLAEWAEILRIPEDTIHARIKYLGWSVERALSKT